LKTRQRLDAGGKWAQRGLRQHKVRTLVDSTNGIHAGLPTVLHAVVDHQRCSAQPRVSEDSSACTFSGVNGDRVNGHSRQRSCRLLHPAYAMSQIAGLCRSENCATTGETSGQKETRGGHPGNSTSGLKLEMVVLSSGLLRPNSGVTGQQTGRLVSWSHRP
jgi:hypothetical protein